ncbi:MAG TPA: hypothetical protein VFN13_09470 [Rudaea sp.]|nr:hypothetical protein [Rudaea sp.]
MTIRKSALHTLTFALLGVVGMALTSSAIARSHLSIGINLPGVSLGYHEGHRGHGRGYVDIGYGGGYYGGYGGGYYDSYGGGYYGGYYAPTPVYYDSYYAYAPPVAVYNGYYSRPYYRHHYRSNYHGSYRSDRHSYRGDGYYHRGSSHRGSYYGRDRGSYRSH